MLSVSTENDNSDGPNVETALSMSPTTAMTTAESHKPTIGTRKQAPAKKGVKTVCCCYEWGGPNAGRFLKLHTYVNMFHFSTISGVRLWSEFRQS